MVIGKELTVRDNNLPSGFDLPDEETLKRQIEAINRFQGLVHQFMVEGQDYGVIPGTSKPSLLKPGAEKITKLLSLADSYELVDRIEDWNKPLFRYLIKCTLTFRGELVSEGMGECNSMEAKYRWRDAKPVCPVCGMETIIKGKKEYGGGWLCWEKKGGCGTKWPDGDPVIEGQATGKVPNDDIYSLVNTILKMAEKRSLVDAALHAGRLSNIFTQDIEDMGDNAPVAANSGATKVQANEKAATKKATDKTDGDAPPPPKSFVDLPWLQESLKTLQAKKLKDWTSAAVITYLNSVTGGQAKSVSEAAAALNKEQAEAFVKRVQDTLQMA
jgi:hypothetical protein